MYFLHQKLFLVTILIFLSSPKPLQGFQDSTDNAPREPAKPTTNATFLGASNSVYRPDLCTFPPPPKSVIKNPKLRWKDSFFVHPDPAFSAHEYDIINAAMYDLSQVLCIKVLIWPQNSQPTGDYAFIRRGALNSGCYSWVGRQGGKQEINLRYNGCINKRTVIHEAVHALGFWHENSRPDRDDYIDILWENINPHHHHAFDIIKEAITFGIPYDQRSIMHYSDDVFSSNGKKTITAKNGGPVGSTGELTTKDIQKLKKMYDCN